MVEFDYDRYLGRYCAAFMLCVAIAVSPVVLNAEQVDPQFVLESAVMCENIHNFKPVHPAVVFSISQGEVFCYSSFDPVREKSFIYHQWYKKDKLISTIRLTLSTPKWASFSSIKTRNADKGPWRVEIRDASDKLIEILRFSMAD